MAYDLFTGRQTPKSWSLGASLLTSTDDVEDRLRSLTVDVNNLNADVTAWFPPHRGEAPAKRFVDAWVRWRDETYKFVRSWREGTFKVKLAWNYVDNAEQRIRELAEWRRRWEQISGERSTAPATVAPPPPRPREEGGGAWKWLAIAGLGAGGALLLAKKIGA